MTGRRLQVFLASVAVIALQAPSGQSQVTFSLDDLGAAPAAARSPAERMSACLEDAAECSQAARRGFSLDDVVNLGIIDRGQAPRDPSAPRSLDAAAPGADATASLDVLPSIDLSAYLSGDAPARSPRRSAELEELAAVLTDPALDGLEVILVVSGPDGTEASGRAAEIAQALEAALGKAVLVTTQTAEVSGLTLTLGPSAP